VNYLRYALAAATIGGVLSAVAEAALAKAKVTTIANLGTADQAPEGSVIFGPNGVLYGTAANSNSLFALTPVQYGWKLSTPLRLPAKLGDSPNGALLSDSAGNLYGVTYDGGPTGCGTVYELLAPATGETKWTGKVLFNLQGGTNDGCQPWGALVADASGDLFGTTAGGGAHGAGTVFELTPPATASTRWSEKLIWSFAGTPDGDTPYAGVVWNEAAGTLYGTTEYGGTGRAGSVYALKQGAGGTWSESVIWSFTNTGGDGHFPGTATVILGPGGTVLGSTGDGGNCDGSDGSGWGIVYQLSPPSSVAPAWTESVLYCLGNGGTTGRGIAQLVADRAGNLFFPTGWGEQGQGPFIYRLSPAGGSTWQATLLAKLTSGAESVNGPLTPDADGNLYGSTDRGGSKQDGTVFELTGSGYQP
jgi:uncharacterized repeat protein (TIGR03803 family)